MSKAKVYGMTKPVPKVPKTDLNFIRQTYYRNHGAPPAKQAGASLNRQERRRLAREKAGA